MILLVISSQPPETSHNQHFHHPLRRRRRNPPPTPSPIAGTGSISNILSFPSLLFLYSDLVQQGALFPSPLRSRTAVVLYPGLCPVPSPSHHQPPEPVRRCSFGVSTSLSTSSVHLQCLATVEFSQLKSFASVTSFHWPSICHPAISRSPPFASWSPPTAVLPTLLLCYSRLTPNVPFWLTRGVPLHFLVD
ncbi:hypothetical protein PIB30_029934 [Stylosanthes scabra]|uniref:Uncharacterized protein n=1 Tax=Stylosanthes scabra TaxID=79078 RepID=A0ABU6VAL7_9FABA|nr:hypothetical protein [Stylosanthes scabra]